MTSSSSPPATDPEPPECPVCLEPYEETSRIPRVLGCGHSSCHNCLTHLSHHTATSLPAKTLRCPACTQLVPFPPSAPSSLPQNIDLLRFSPSSAATTPPRRRTHPPKFTDPFFSDEIYSAWISWVLPCDTILTYDHLTATIRVTDSIKNGVVRCRLDDRQQVRLTQVGHFHHSANHHIRFEYSYLAKVMTVLTSMTHAYRNELLSLLSISLRVSKVCTLFGLWLDVESGCVYFVSELLNRSLLDLRDEKHHDGGVGLLESVGVELCEVLICLQREGFVCGCFGLSCVCFDDFGHVRLDLTEVLAKARKVYECVAERVNGKHDSEQGDFVVNLLQIDVFVSPEVLVDVFCRAGVDVEKNCCTSYASDVWLLACSLLRLIIGSEFVEEMGTYLSAVLETTSPGVSEWSIMYLTWLDKVTAILDSVKGSFSTLLQEMLLKCLDFVPEARPLVTDVWKNIKTLNNGHHGSFVTSFDGALMEEGSGKCLALQELCNTSNYRRDETCVSSLNEEQDDGIIGPRKAGDARVGNLFKGLAAGKVQSADLVGHLDSITGFCVGGGFLFSSSFDKTVNVWSLQDFTCVHTYRGHEQRVMAVVYLTLEKPLCVSADSGGGICTWQVVHPFSEEPLMKWYEEKDWRYSGIHALAVSESGHLYTGSGDRLIKVWSLRDYTVLCKMEGHKSVVSTLALANGVLYSGSWDGTVRLWNLNDHSPLAVFGEDMPGIVSSVLSLCADQNLVIAAYEKGDIKIWANDMLKASKHIHHGAAFALAYADNGLFSGGWDKTVHVQEIRGAGAEMDFQDIGSIACDSAITALMYVKGMLFVGYANKLIKVFL